MGRAEIAAGTFPTAEDAVRYALSELPVNALRATLDAAVAEGESNSTEEVRAHVREHLEKRKPATAS